MKSNYFSYYCPDCSYTFRDFMWLPTKIFVNGDNFYNLILNNEYKLVADYNKNPNYPMYSIVTYFILFPFGLLSFEEAKEIGLILNCFIIIHIFIIFHKNNIIPEKKLLLILIIFLLSKPLIYSVALGQYSLLSLYGFVCFFYVKNKIIKVFTIIVSFCKFTFVPVLGFYFVFKKEYLIIFLLAIVNFICLMAFALLFDDSIIKSFLYQFIIPANNLTSGAVDLMTLIGNHPKPPLNYILILFITVIFYTFYYRYTRRNTLADLSSICLITIIFIRHLYYDMIFLLPFLIYLLKDKKLKKSCFIIIIHIFFTYYNGLTADIVRYNKAFMLINFLILLYCLFYIFYKEKKIYFFDKKLKKIKFI